MAVTHWLLSTAIAKYWRLRVGLKTALRSLIPRQFTKCQLLKETCTRWMLLQGNASPYTGKVCAMYLSIIYIYAFISLCTYGSVDRELGCYPHLLLNKDYEKVSSQNLHYLCWHGLHRLWFENFSPTTLSEVDWLHVTTCGRMADYDWWILNLVGKSTSLVKLVLHPAVSINENQKSIPVNWVSIDFIDQYWFSLNICKLQW